MIKMRTLTIRSLDTKTHPETRKLFWLMFAATKGGLNRMKIISHIRNSPSNMHQLSKLMKIDYKSVQHHIRVLERNNMVTKVGTNYGVTYFPSVLFEESQDVFDEIAIKLRI